MDGICVAYPNKGFDKFEAGRIQNKVRILLWNRKLVRVCVLNWLQANTSRQQYSTIFQFANPVLPDWVPSESRDYGIEKWAGSRDPGIWITTSNTIKSLKSKLKNDNNKIL